MRPLLTSTISGWSVRPPLNFHHLRRERTLPSSANQGARLFQFVPGVSCVVRFSTCSRQYTYATARTPLHAHHFTQANRRTPLHAGHCTQDTARRPLHARHCSHAAERMPLHANTLTPLPANYTPHLHANYTSTHSRAYTKTTCQRIVKNMQFRTEHASILLQIQTTLAPTRIIRL